MQTESKSTLAGITSDYAFPPKRILAAIDGSENSSRALQAAIEVARQFNSELLIITVTLRNPRILGEPGLTQNIYDDMDRRSEQILSHAAEQAKKAGIAKVMTKAIPEFDSVPKQILEEAENKKADLIVVGTRGLGGFKKLTVGSVSRSVLTHAECNVMIVR